MADLTRPPEWAVGYDAARFTAFAWTTDVVALALAPEGHGLAALVVERGGEPFRGMEAWPGGFVDAQGDADARAAALRELREEADVGEPPFLEELGTYGRRGRDPRQFAGCLDPATGRWEARGARVVSTAHLALLREGDAEPAGGDDAASARWADVYAFLPWEDRRTPDGAAARAAIRDALAGWRDAEGAAKEAREARVERAFAFASGRWNEELAAERLALLHEAGRVEEAHRDRWGRLPDGGPPARTFGRAMAFDHRRMLADALARVRGKLKYVPRVLHALAGDRFTLDELQAAVEAAAGRPLHRANFRRTVSATRAAIVEPTGEVRETGGPGVPPRLFRFRAEALGRRLPAALRLPWAPLA